MAAFQVDDNQHFNERTWILADTQTSTSPMILTFYFPQFPTLFLLRRVSFYRNTEGIKHAAWNSLALVFSFRCCLVCCASSVAMPRDEEPSIVRCICVHLSSFICLWSFICDGQIDLRRSFCVFCYLMGLSWTVLIHLSLKSVIVNSSCQWFLPWFAD